jgi:hypothetical protein
MVLDLLAVMLRCEWRWVTSLIAAEAERLASQQ